MEDCHLYELPDPGRFVAALVQFLAYTIWDTILSQCITCPCARSLITQIYSHHILLLKSDA